MKRALIVGGGIGGCVATRLLKSKNWNVTLVHPEVDLGGGVRTRFMAGHPYTFGPRHFLTQDEKVYSYLASILPMRLCSEHQFISFVDSDSAFYNYPIHMDDIPRMPERDIIMQELSMLESSFRDAEYKCSIGEPDLETKANNYEDFWIKSIGPTLYNKLIEKYTKKMWLIEDNKSLDDFTWSPKGVAIKSGPRAGWDTAISAFPMEPDGYNSLFDTAKEIADSVMVAKVDRIEPGTLTAEIGGECFQYDAIINTAALDDIFGGIYPDLTYIGRRLEFLVLPVDSAMPKDVYFTYYTGDEKYTRAVEYKKFYRYNSPHTLISLEYPERNAGKFYPLPKRSEQQLHSQYLGLCHHRHFNAGRIALFNYRYDIDDVIGQVLDIVAGLE